MRAAVIEAPRKVGLTDVTVPAPGPGQVLIRVAGSGICGSEIPAYEGRRWFDYPLPAGTPGHEGWGTVAERGTGVDTVEVGARVAMLSERAHAEYDLAAAGSVVPIPDTIGAGPFPGEALGCAMNIFTRSDIRAGQTVAVVGIGFLGALLTQLAARAGARVIAVSRRSSSLDMAEQMGADEVVPAEGDALADIEKLTGGKLCDRVIECTGAQRPLDLSSALTRVRGRLIIAGYHQDGARNVDMQLWNWRGLDVINAHERDPRAYVKGIRHAVKAIEAGELDPSPLYTHVFPLQDVDTAFRTASERPPGFMKALVVA